MERLDCSEGSYCLDGRGKVGIVVQKEEMDASMPLKRPTSNEEVGKVKKIVELKHEVLKLTRVHLKQLEKKGL